MSRGIDVSAEAMEEGIMNYTQTVRRIALIVEDDADQRWLTTMLLEEHGFETVECESAEAALATMLLRGPAICMVFTDLRLSGVMDGSDLARELKVRWPHLVLVLTSGNPGPRLVHIPPGVEFMPKPWEPAQLLGIAERA
jgi:DNA-binding NtrC family response regulator